MASAAGEPGAGRSSPRACSRIRDRCTLSLMPFSPRIQASGVTDVGQRRTTNEDAFRMSPELGLWLVVDGAGGDLGARITVETVQTFFEETRRDPDDAGPVVPDLGRTHEENRLCAALKLVNERIFT